MSATRCVAGAVPDRLATLRECGLLPMVQYAAVREGATVADVIGARRYAHLVRARAAVWIHLHDDRRMSYTAIGRLFGRDHTTVIAIVAGYRGKVDTLCDPSMHTLAKASTTREAGSGQWVDLGAA